MITVYNKMDIVKDSTLLPNEKPQAFVSARTGEGLEDLLILIQDNLPERCSGNHSTSV